MILAPGASLQVQGAMNAIACSLVACSRNEWSLSNVACSPPAPRPLPQLSKLPGVTKTRVGYTGGRTASPTYKSVCAGDGHTEALQIWFDPAEISYEHLLEVCRGIGIIRSWHQ